MISFDDILPMYNGINGSPITTLTTQYNTEENTTSITVLDGSVLPDTVPNICTLYTSAGANSGMAVIKYTTKTDNVLSGISVEYKNSDSELTFPVGTFVSRKYTEEDHNAFKTNIEILNTITRALVDYIQPTPAISTFSIPDLPTVVPIGSQYTGTHTLTHKETLPKFIDGNMELYEQTEKILEFEPSATETQVSFTADMQFETAGTYAYTLKCKDITGNVISKSVSTTTVTNTLYIGHSSAETMTAEILDTLSISAECYDGMTAKVTADNDYVWFCILQPCTITGVTSSGFTVPMETVQTVSKQIGTQQYTFNCYRTTAQILAGYENEFKLSINFG